MEIWVQMHGVPLEKMNSYTARKIGKNARWRKEKSAEEEGDEEVREDESNTRGVEMDWQENSGVGKRGMGKENLEKEAIRNSKEVSYPKERIRL
ncbi:hypothetical protein PIB30_028794 [Stylosanthes scabra]|uniref:DUF4283 domain-containing protein n=1 Tax=Stylosanthes scabra TaxID=79078 RepID=A0ABU6RBI9_9FABA|nr:hypothetical protein [Stylosanthes scabra]